MRLTVIETILTGAILFGCQMKNTTEATGDKDTVKSQISDATRIDTSNSIAANLNARVERPATKDTVKSQISDANTIDTTNSIAANSECTRGAARAVVKKAIYPSALFKLNEDHHTGTETVELKNGDKLIIRNWGCEYYILTFRFETERFQADTTEIKYWMDKAIILMGQIEPAIDALLDIPGGTLATKNLLKDKKGYQLGEKVFFNNSEIREFVTFDRVQKINDSRFAIEVSYGTGPL